MGDALQLVISALLSAQHKMFRNKATFLFKGFQVPQVILEGRGAGDRFGDYLCVDCANLPHVVDSVHYQFTHTKFTRPNSNISKYPTLVPSFAETIM